MSYAELQVTTHFSFLRGASGCEELFAQAALLGIAALGIADRHSLAGVVRAFEAERVTGVRSIVGCRLDLEDGMAVLVYPTDRPAYSRLCRLLTIGKGRAGKGDCRLGWQDLVEYGAGQLAILVPDQPDDVCAERLSRLRGAFGDRAYLALTLRRRPGDAMRLHDLAELAARGRVPTVATNDVLYHVPGRRILQDVVTCIREGCTIEDAGFRRERFADRYLKRPDEMARLFQRFPEAVARSLEIADRCKFKLDQLSYQYPHEVVTAGMTAQQTLEQNTWSGAAERYPEGVPSTVVKQLEHELELIEELEYAPYFLTVEKIVKKAREMGILCQGRGSAANSAVCFVLGITCLNPTKSKLLFERFISRARKEPPDIDVDFDHDRREEVIQWIYEEYGRDRAALCATVIRYRSRGAIRDVGKALGLTEDVTAALASQVWGWSEEGVEDKHAAGLNMNLEDRRLRLALALARELIGFPRHLSQHPGGFVLTEDRLDELVPIEPAAMEKRAVIEWDKDDIETLRFMKVDVLGLGMLGCLRRCFDLLRAHKGLDYGIATIPHDDKPTYDMICKADTLGVFQIESRAQMSMLPRLRPREFYDLVIEVAIVRPGPIQGDMVHPYLRRRDGKEKPEYPKPELEEVLKNTLGVPLFQEQAMRIAMECAGFSAEKADQLRRSMATFKATGSVSNFKQELIDGMIARDYTREFAERTITQIEGFGSYGFPESHAASFALLAYVSSWLKCHHPDVFCAALLNSQPMGFYAPAQIVRDARQHAVEVRAVDLNHSDWDCTLEPRPDGSFAVRLGLRMVKGLAEEDGRKIAEKHPYASVDDLWRRAGIQVEALAHLATADGYGSLGLSRRQALWAVKGLRDEALPLFAATPREIVEPAVPLAPMTAGREVEEDYGRVGLTLRDHPVAFLREDLAREGFIPCKRLETVADGRRVEVAGVVLVRQRPGSAKGVMFITVEDESSHANIVVWQTLFEKYRREILSARMLGVIGKLQKEREVIHVVADRLIDLTPLLRSVGGRNFPLPHGRGDEARRGSSADSRGLIRRARDIDVPERGTAGIKVKTRDFR